MSAQRNASHPNLNIGNRNPRSYARSRRPTIQACRICDKVFLTRISLLEHHREHELSPITQNLQIPTYTPPRLFSQSNSQMFQQAHPYFRNGHTMLSRQRINGPQINIYYGQPQTPNVVQARHSVLNNGAIGHPLPFPNSILGGAIEGGNQIDFVNSQQHEESTEERTVWYLNRMENPIPRVIDRL